MRKILYAFSKGLKCIVLPFILIWTMVRFNNIWKLKFYLYNKKNFKLKALFIKIYDLRLALRGSWIGYNSTFKDQPTFPHGISGIFVSGGAVVGKNCVIYQQVTIGSNTLKGNAHFGSPIIGDNVLIGAGAKIIGKVTVGNNVRVGANAVVVRDVPDNCVVVSSEKVIQKDHILDNRFYSHHPTKGFGYIRNGEFIVDEDVSVSE